MTRPQLLQKGFLNGKYTISTCARREGGTGVFIPLPMAACRDLLQNGWDGTWLAIEGRWGFLAHARRSKTCYSVALPRRFQDGVQLGEELVLVIYDPSAQRVPETDRAFLNNSLDWAALLPEQVFAAQTGEVLELHSRYERPFTLKRFAPRHAMRMFGFYYAEGSKSVIGPDWCISQNGPAPLKWLADVLGEMGIGRERLYLEALHGPDQDPAEVAYRYTVVGVEITSIRPRPGRGVDAGVLHVRNSLNFKRMTCALYKHLEEGGVDSLPADACLEFSLGFLDGDGNVTLMPSPSICTHLRFFGADETQGNLVLKMLNKGMGWDLPLKHNLKSKASGGGDEQRWAIDALKTAQLIDVNAFPHSPNRQKLEIGLKRQTESFLTVWTTCAGRTLSFQEMMQAAGVNHGVIAALRMHGYLEGEKESLKLSRKGNLLAETLNRLSARR